MSVRARQVAHTLTTYAFTRVVLGGLTGVIVSRALGPAGRGHYAVLLALATLVVSIGHLSVDQSQTALWPRSPARSAIAANSALLGPLVGGGAAAAAGLVVVRSGVVAVPSDRLLAAALLTVPCGVTVLYLGNVLILRGQIHWVNRSGLLGAAAQWSACVLAAVTGRLSLGCAVAAWTLCATVPLVVLVPAVRPRLRDRDLGLARDALGIGLRYHVGVVALVLLFRVDVLILGHLAISAAVGVYALAVSLAELTRVAADSVAQVAMSRQMEDDRAAAAAFTVRAVRFAAILSAGSMLLMCVTAPVLVPVVFGTGFTGGVRCLYALAPGMWALGVLRPATAFLVRLGRPLIMSSTSLAALLVNVGLNLVLIRRHGAMGCAVAASAGYGTLAVAQIGWLLHATGTPLRRLRPGLEDLRSLMSALGTLRRVPWSPLALAQASRARGRRYARRDM